MDNLYDITIIGAGPAGLTAAIYASRRNLSVLVLSIDLGGQMAKTAMIENYPGFDEMIDGSALAMKMQKQAANFGAEFKFLAVESITKNKFFEVKAQNSETFKSKSLILAFGLTPQKLDVPGEKEFYGKGVTYCATCDGPLYKGKTVAVIGGGNSAIETARYLAEICHKVYLIHRRDRFRGEEMGVESLKNQPNVELVLNSVVEKIKGDNFVTEIDVKNVKTEKSRKINLNGVFIEIGWVANRQFIDGLVELDRAGQIKVNEACATSLDGCFAAGDITDVIYKQIAIATGQGAIAALSAYKHLQRRG